MEEPIHVPRLINKKAVKAFLLAYAQRHRAHRFTRVANAVLNDIESATATKCRAIVNCHPSLGKTIR